MRFTSELTIKAAWRIVASGHEQWKQTGSIEPDNLVRVRKVQIEMAQHLAAFEDGPAILFTAWSTRRQLRQIEQMASDLICLNDGGTRCASGAVAALYGNLSDLSRPLGGSKATISRGGGRQD